MKPFHRISLSCVVLVFLANPLSIHAQDGKLNVQVTPRHAYIFIDGHAMSEASKRHSFSLGPGDHKVEIVNYGYTPVSRTVTITTGETANIEVTLNPVSTTVTGPFGAMTIEGGSRDAVLLNGKTPDFFVGHGDEFNHEWWWKQELVVPPGKYDVTVLHEDKPAWEGPVEVPANQRVVIDVPKGVRKTVAWPRGEKLGTVSRFSAGTASATVAVAKPTAELAATASQINCGDSSQLKWGSTDAPQVQITPVGSVATSGEQAVQPKQTTNYELTALGPGGTATSAATVNVNTAVQSSLALSPAEVQYKRIGDKVLQEGSTALNWTATNASVVSIDPLGTVDANGNRTLPVKPQKNDPGSIDESVTYTLTAKNECGGSDTKTATLRIVGTIEPQPQLATRSVYFPTDLPGNVNSDDALLSSEKETLTSIADSFKKYLEYKPESHLTLIGHADKRGPQAYNQPLSERRAQLAKAFLVQQGIPEDKIETEAYGSEKNLSASEVKNLLEQNADLSTEDREKLLAKLPTIVFAYNRRVDVNLSPTGQQSTLQYPVQASDFATLIDRNGPNQQAESLVQPAAIKEREKN
jgi:outer membrane protein OmpA-like peptidoglycan-associated protein